MAELCMTKIFTTSSGMVDFGLKKNCKNDDFSKENCKLAWEFL